jgi:ketosteroid isomerase-like protein
MSQENVEIVLRQWDAWNDGDLDAWAQAWDSETVVVAPRDWPEGAESRGLDAWRRQSERLRSTWAEARVEVDEIREVQDRVHARIRYVTRGTDTGIPFETPMGVVLVLSGGRITRGYFGWTMAEALEAAGVSK